MHVFMVIFYYYLNIACDCSRISCVVSFVYFLFLVIHFMLVQEHEIAYCKNT